MLEAFTRGARVQELAGKVREPGPEKPCRWAKFLRERKGTCGAPLSDWTCTHPDHSDTSAVLTQRFCQTGKHCRFWNLPVAGDIKISFCFNVLDEGPRLRKTIESFRENLQGWPHEFIVVDDASTDGCCEDLGDDVTVIGNGKRLGCGKSKRIATEVGEGAVLAFFDAHHIVEKGRLSDAALVAFERKCVVVPVTTNIEYDEEWNTRRAMKNDGSRSSLAYAGHRLRWKKQGGVALNTNHNTSGNDLLKIDAVSVGVFVRKDVLQERLGGWHGYPGVHGHQEQGFSLKCWFAGVDIYALRSLWIAHEFRTKGWIYEPPSYLDRPLNTWFAASVVFGDQFMAEYVAPAIRRGGPGYEAGEATVESASNLASEREFFQEKCKRRTDEEFGRHIGLLAPKATVSAVPRGPDAVDCMCLTYGRATILQDAIAAFVAQDYPHKHLWILNDGSEPLRMQEPRPDVTILNVGTKYGTLGEKRQTLLRFVQARYAAIWDDDDIMLPWYLSSGIRGFTASYKAVKVKHPWMQDGSGDARKLTCPNVPCDGSLIFETEAVRALGGFPPVPKAPGRILMDTIKVARLLREVETYPASAYVIRRDIGVAHTCIGRKIDGKNDDFGSWDKPLVPSDLTDFYDFFVPAAEGLMPESNHAAFRAALGRA